MYAKKVWLTFFIISLPNITFANGLTISKLRKYCNSLDLDTWKGLSVYEAHKRMQSPTTIESTTKLLKLQLRSPDSFSASDQTKINQLSREHLAAFIVYFFPFELSETNSTLRAKLTQEATELVSRHNILCKSVHRFTKHHLDMDEYMDLSDKVLTLKKVSWGFVQSLRRFVRQDKVYMTQTMIAKFIEIEKRYLATKRREDSESFDFERGFNLQLQGLEKAIMRVSGADGLQLLKEQRELLQQQISDVEYQRLSGLDLYRKKVFDPNFRLSLDTKKQSLVKLRKFVETSRLLDGKEKTDKLFTAFKSLRTLLLTVKPLKKDVREEVLSNLANVQLMLMAEDLESEAANSTLQFIIRKITEWGATTVNSDIANALHERKVEEALPDIVSIIAYHLEKLAVEFQNFGLDQVTVDILAKLDKEQFTKEFDSFEVSLTKTAKYVKEVFKENNSDLRYRNTDDILIHAAVDAVENTGLFLKDKHDLPEVFLGYHNIFQDYNSHIAHILRKSQILLIFMQIMQKFSLEITERDLVEISHVLDIGRELEDEDAILQAIIFTTKIIQERESSEQDASSIKEDVSKFYSLVKGNSPIADLIKRRLKQQIKYFLERGYFPSITLSPAEKFIQKDLLMLLKNLQSILLVIKKAHSERIQGMFDSVKLDQLFTRASDRQRAATDSSGIEKSKYQRATNKLNKLAFVLHTFTILRTVVNADSFDWREDVLSIEDFGRIIKERDLVNAINDSSVELSKLKKLSHELLLQITIEKKLTFHLPEDSTIDDISSSSEFIRSKRMLTARLTSNPSYKHMQRYLLDIIKQYVKYGKYRGKTDMILELFAEQVASLCENYRVLARQHLDRSETASVGLFEPLPVMRSGLK